jgi:hypothetical protein
MDLLKNGEKLYLNYFPVIISRFSPIQPGTEDDYSHYLYLDEKTGLFFEFDKRRQKTHHVGIDFVQEVLEDLELEQKRVTNFFNQTN